MPRIAPVIANAKLYWGDSSFLCQGSLNISNFRSKAVNLLTVDKVEEICKLKFNCESNVKPKCLWDLTRLTGRLLNKIVSI